MLPLSNFGTVSFADATADNTAIGNENPGALTMVSANDVTEATPSALTGGNAFTRDLGQQRHHGHSRTPAGTTTAPGTGGTPGRHHHRHHHWFGD